MKLRVEGDENYVAHLIRGNVLYFRPSLYKQKSFRREGNSLIIELEEVPFTFQKDSGGPEVIENMQGIEKVIFSKV